MLGKLLKYDLKWCYKPLIVFYALAFIFSVLARIVDYMPSSFFTLIVGEVSLFMAISMFISIIMNCMMRNWVRFLRNIYKDEAYLTHTLPVSKNEIYLSKVLTGIITLFTSLVVIVLCFNICFMDQTSWLNFVEYFKNTSLYFHCSLPVFLSLITLLIFLELLFMLLTGYLGIIMGNKKNNYKIMKSIIRGIQIYIVFSCLIVIILYIIGLYNQDIMSIFKSLDMNDGAIKNVMICTTGIYIIYNIIIGIISKYLLNKGVNID